MPKGRRALLPAKMTSSILVPRRYLDALFTHDPADGIGNIALAAAIWPNNGRDPIFEIDIDLIGKGLEAMGFK